MKWIAILRKIQWGFLALLLATLLGIAAWNWQARTSKQGGWEEKHLEGLKVYKTVPNFSLVERSGRKIGLADLKSKVWVAQFFYTNCRDICPLTVPQMGLLHLEYQKDPEFRADVRFVSITVNPERDTPEALIKFADRFSADPERWFFLTGDRSAIYHLAQEGFGVGIGEEENPPEVKEKTGEKKEFFHSARLILVDRKGQIRGYYSGLEAEAMVRLRRDLKALLGTEDVVS